MTAMDEFLALLGWIWSMISLQSLYPLVGKRVWVAGHRGMVGGAAAAS